MVEAMPNYVTFSTHVSILVLLDGSNTSIIGFIICNWRISE